MKYKHRLGWLILLAESGEGTSSPVGRFFPYSLHSPKCDWRKNALAVHIKHNVTCLLEVAVIKLFSLYLKGCKMSHDSVLGMPLGW